MTILAKLSNPNLFSSLPPTPPSPQTPPKPLPSKPPIPIPKYPPPKKRPPNSQNTPSNPAFKIPHANTKYYKPVKPGQVLTASDDRAVVIGESGVSYLLPGAPFEFQFSYSETPKEKPLAIREPAFLPFAPPSMPRPWTGKAPLKGKQKKVPIFDSFNPPPPGKKGVKYVERPGPYLFGKYPEEAKSREEILGEPLKKWEIKMLIQPLISDNRQINLGRDGLTHNMLELIHCHWKRRRVCKVRSRGVPTVDMDNICHHLEEKTGGKIIHRVGGVVYLFRGRNYNYRTRPQYPVMLWKPAAPVYQKLIQEAPEGLTKAEADEMRKKGKHLMPICKLAKNGIYLTLVKDVRNGFEGSPLVKVDCRGMHASDYKKLGAKLKDLVPCVLLSFDDEQILMWRGPNWKSMYPEPRPTGLPVTIGETDNVCKSSGSRLPISGKVMSLWKHAIESNKALLLDDINPGPDDLLTKVEEFEGISKAEEHSYQAYVVSNENAADDIAEAYGYTSNSEEYDEDDIDDDYEDEIYDSDPLEELDSSAPLGSLSVDRIAKTLPRKVGKTFGL